MGQYVNAKLYSHQREAAALVAEKLVLDGRIGSAIQSRGAALLMEQGTGKTLVAIEAIGKGYAEKLVRKVLIVCPLSVIPAWKAEFEKAVFDHEVLMLNHPKISTRQEQLRGFSESGKVLVVLCNYEALAKLADNLIRWRPDMMICDESQKIKSVKAKQTRTVWKIGGFVRRKMILTGTPITQSPLDFWSQYRFADRTIFNPSYWDFRNRHAVFGGYENRLIVGHRFLPEITQKAYRIAYRATKAECLDLPESIDQRLYACFTPEEKRVYKKMSAESIINLKNEELSAPNVLVEFMRLAQITGGFIKGEQVTGAKLRLLSETVDDILERGEKVVIFARFIDEIRAIRKMLIEKKIKYSEITGETPGNRRGEEVSKFQNRPDVEVIVCQIQAGGVGITLTAASTAIFYSYDFSYANLDQAKARLHRIGQHKPVTNIFLLVKDTLDEYILSAVEKKQSTADLVLDVYKKLFG